MKRSQVTLFVIIGIIILIVVAAVFLSKNNGVASVELESKKVEMFDNTKQTVNIYIERCLESATMRAISKYGINYSDFALSHFVDIHMMDCLDDFSLFRDQGYGFIYSKPYANVSVAGHKVSTDLLFDVNMSYEEQRTEFMNFNYGTILPADFKNPNEGFTWIFQGILFMANKTTIPRPLKYWVVKIDLDDANLSYFVTPRIAPDTMITSDFLVQNHLQLATNGGGFNVSDTKEVNGFAASGGVVYSMPDLLPGETIFVTKENKVTIGPAIPPDMEYAVSGFNHMVEGGKILDRFLNKNDPSHKPGYDNLEPRTSYGIDDDLNWLVLIVVDGRDPGISEGVDLKELGQMQLDYGSTNAINMDGGGSTTLVLEKGPSFEVQNNPSDGAERPVANHFGVWALPLK